MDTERLPYDTVQESIRQLPTMSPDEIEQLVPELEAAVRRIKAAWAEAQRPQLRLIESDESD